MLIHINKSKLFTVEPAKRFAKEFNVDESVWIKSWLKYKVYGYSVSEVCDYVHVLTGRKPSYNSVSRWIVRTEIYSLALEARKMGAQTVVSSFFGIYAKNVEHELFKHMKSGVTTNSRSMV